MISNDNTFFWQQYSNNDTNTAVAEILPYASYSFGVSFFYKSYL
jgi:hypothetical protein